MQIIIKIIITVLLLGCLLHVPYGYFQFIKIASFMGFAWLGYNYLEKGKALSGILSAGLMILLNPFFKIHFTRKVWNQIDIAIAIILIIWIVIDFAGIKKNKS